MVSQQALDYVNEQLALGVSKERITQDLLSNGWPQLEIDNTFDALNQALNSTLDKILSASSAEDNPNTQTIQSQKGSSMLLLIVTALVTALFIGWGVFTNVSVAYLAVGLSLLSSSYSLALLPSIFLSIVFLPWCIENW